MFHVLGVDDFCFFSCLHVIFCAFTLSTNKQVVSKIKIVSNLK